MLRRIFGDIVVRKRTGFVECEDATICTLKRQPPKANICIILEENLFYTFQSS